ncbi:MAG: CPBP family intramembrane metalloprotease [Phycisphaerae bacterium]|nr:MAG: CPBP family intramembrane metalloprotease [Planctomycetota bacterium]KAB2944390.1 MAG: CPBP family intramembrane metalloprotease [Phycisphaerae bacterium]MBE7457254.1 CPBP family intramembrane metalloprotease [Planctomycetia bacterium]MCK6465470.1 CPBP family intramembrane metalloprotease [Phycisphaerae bacterium]MCL4719137.1 CPBP family intramembrane metalloprotease [Phycisphaerae bacterium]
MNRDRPGVARMAFAAALILYTGLFLVVPPREALPDGWADGWLAVRKALFDRIGDGIERATVRWTGSAPSPAVKRHAANAVYFTLILTVAPAGVMALLRRGRPSDYGTRRPNRQGWRLLIVGYAVALPFLIWMVASPSFVPYYIRDLRASPATFLSSYAVMMFGEHLYLHGVVLALSCPGGRWPEPRLACPTQSALLEGAPDRMPDGRRAIAILRWLGFAQARDGGRGWRGVTRWLGLPDGATAALLMSTFLFGLVHWGKDPREFLLSVPGGLASAYLALRGGSWLVPFLLHLATAGTACLLMLSAAPVAR